MSLFWHSPLVKRDFFQPREYQGQYLSFAEQTLVELNPNILVRDEERMEFFFYQFDKALEKLWSGKVLSCSYAIEIES